MAPKPFASLTSSLLARKGTAKPAMRPQVFNPNLGSEDLGWNDMGYGTPPVVRQQAELAAAIAEAPAPQREPVTDPAPTVAIEPESCPVLKPAVLPRISGKKAAFTLRLDAERHLRLRLTCAMEGRSAQQIVTEALDALLATKPQIAEMADSAPRPPR